MTEASTVRVARAALERFIDAVLQQAGADEPTAQAVTRALLHASSLGVDSHGLRLLPHYLKVLAGGRVNGRPALRFERRAPGAGYLDADNAFGHLAGYRAIEHGIEIAQEIGVATVAVGNSSHFGAAGVYTLAAAEQGYLAIAVCNSDPAVLPHDGTRPFHGTDPISVAAPVPGQKPYLLDMATSSIPLNRVHQYLAIGTRLPPDVAANAQGHPTQDPAQVVALYPLGGATYGYKGAGLAGITEILSSALTGMAFSTQLLPFAGPDLSTPRRLGQFFIVMRPDAFLPQEVYARQMTRYLADLRDQPALPGTKVMAPGDREWVVEEERNAHGIPVDFANWEIYTDLAKQFGVPSLASLPAR